MPSVLLSSADKEFATRVFQVSTTATMFGGNNHNRKYVDLIFQSRGKYPNLDPTTSMEVGDYGFVTKDTAMFLKQGNIFKENLAQGLASETGSRMDFVVMMAEGTKSFDAGGNFGSSIPGFADCSIKSRYSFSRGSGAALVMYQPIVTTINNQGNIKKLYEDGVLKKDQAVITQVFACQSYALLLGGKKGGEALLGFRAKSPPIGGYDVGASSHVGWVGNTSSGEWQWAHDANERDVYFPLCVLGGISPRVGVQDLRNSPMPKDDETDQLSIYPPPWGLLDEDGSEKIFVDNVREDSDDDE